MEKKVRIVFYLVNVPAIQIIRHCFSVLNEMIFIANKHNQINPNKEP